MIKEALKPNKIQDIVFRIHEYLPEMRKMEKDEAVEFVSFLESYIKEYFTKGTDNLELKKLSVELTDVLYLQISSFELRDIHTDGYFGIVVNRLFWELLQKGVLCFYILDNSLRDDRFKMAVELYKSSGFETIYPYVTGELKYSDEYTRLPIKDYKSIEKEIDESKSNRRHILYVEKDDSVNELENVLHLAEEFQSEYVCIFRNKAPSDHQNATWLLGSFGDMLKL
ncbi:MAG: hypothetical protein A2W42_06875 [Candidatus Muproteobacteria bacterium RIFCSPHIGHO2_01_60_12]|nr:MAG: hypothetical protein A2W42_06875 [Candidatus Muproteobacteria bacterium RIFCSPHIGHO2_01_60_12]